MSGLNRLIYNAIRRGNISLAKFSDDIPLDFGSSKDVSVAWDGSALNILPLTDDVGAINIGNGTKDIDFKIFLGSTAKYVDFNVGDSKAYFSGIPIDFAGAFTEHMIYAPATATLATNKRVIRIGDYGTEFPVVGGQGIIRTYCKIPSGSGATALQFHWGITECAAGIIGSQIQMESWAGTPGPTVVHCESFIAGIAEGKYLAASVGVLDGMYTTWHKVYAPVGAICNGDVFPVWIDNQMSCAVGGVEAGIKTSTGGSVPDAFVWFNTTSGGWASLFYFDSTMASKPPLGAGSLKDSDDADIKCDKYLINNINGTPYYIPLYDTLN